MKKGFILGVIFGLMLMSTIGFVSAQGVRDIGIQIGDFLSGLIDGIKPLLQILVGDISGIGGLSSDAIFFAKVLILVLVFALVYDILSITGFFDKPWVIWTISIVVPILGVRFLTPSMVAAVAIPNTALAISIAAGLPFVLYFFFVQRLASRTMRRIAWVFFAVVFLFVWGANAENSFAWIYVVATVAAVAMLFLDGTIRRWWKQVEYEKSLSTENYVRYTGLSKQRESVYGAYLKAVEEGHTKQANDLLARIDRLDKAIVNLRGK